MVSISRNSSSNNNNNINIKKQGKKNVMTISSVFLDGLDTKTLLLIFMALYAMVSFYYYVTFMNNHHNNNNNNNDCECADKNKNNKKKKNHHHVGAIAGASPTLVERKPIPKIGKDSCLSLNSPEWLNELNRYGNVNDEDEMLNVNFIQHMIVDAHKVLLQPQTTDAYLLRQSICHPNSRLLNDTSLLGAASAQQHDPYAIRLWAVRLIYWAIHYHQHHYALSEAKLRLKHLQQQQQQQQQPSSCAADMQNHNIGWFDYECPKAKYLVVSLGGYGLGINMRIVAATSLLVGLATNRVVIFMNNAQGFRDDDLERCRDLQSPGCPWPLVSCPRKDMQCFFMPSTPCTLTPEQLNNAYHLPWNESRRLSVRGSIPEGHEHDKVWILRPAVVPMGKTVLSMQPRKALAAILRSFMKHVPQQDPRRDIFRLAIQSIAEHDQRREGYHYLAATDKLRHALTMYAMRPGFQSKQKLSRILQEIVPKGLVPENSIGLPIRASDKCKTESECLSFEEHLQVTSHTWTRHLQNISKKTGKALAKRNMHPTIIFTTESKLVIADQEEYLHNRTLQAKFPYQFEFVSNTKDVAPDSGFIADVVRGADGDTLTADDALLGAMSSLQFQLLPRVSIGNCCSNFHILLNDFLMEGCGAASQNDFLCLNEYEGDPALKLCCGWHKSCLETKQQYKEMIQNGTIVRPAAAATVQS